MDLDSARDTLRPLKRPLHDASVFSSFSSFFFCLLVDARFIAPRALVSIAPSAAGFSPASWAWLIIVRKLVR